MRLQNRFFVTLGITFLTSFLIVAVIFYRGALSQAEHEAMREARMTLAAATAARIYSSDRVTPLLAARPPQAFAPESVPSFAAQTIMKGFNTDFPEYTYRETALNPTNLDNLPRAWEADIIQRFRQDPALQELSGERTEKAQLLFYIAQPIRISDPACLACHSEPKNAPAPMLATYGSTHGFGWKQDEIIGAKFVVVPKSERLASALSGVFWFLIALGCVLIVAVMVTVFMVQREVAAPVQRLAEQAERLSVGEHGAKEIESEGAAEFRKLASAINRLHRSLMLLMKDAEDAPDRAGARVET
jgi:methyl-accepting chemotaxis protein